MISQDKRMERILVLASLVSLSMGQDTGTGTGPGMLMLASLVSLSMGQGLLTITQHPRDTHVAPGGTVRFQNRLKYFCDFKAPVPSQLPNKMIFVIANLIFAV